MDTIPIKHVVGHTLTVSLLRRSLFYEPTGQSVKS